MNATVRAIVLTTALVWIAFTTNAQPSDPTTPRTSVLQFYGTNAYVNFTPAIANRSIGDFTICGWFYVENNTAGQYLYRFSNAESSTRRIQITETSGTITADIRTTTGAGSIYSITYDVGYNGWAHLAFVRSGDLLRLYVNGQEVGSQAAAATAIPLKWGYLGANTYNGSTWGKPMNFFKGMIDEFQIWTNALGSDAIASLMTLPMSAAVLTQPGILGGWGFNEQSGDVALDASGHGFTAGVSNAVWKLPPSFTLDSLRPGNGAMFVPTNSGIYFTVDPGMSGINSGAVRLELNGQDVSSGLQINTTVSPWEGAYLGNLQPNRFYYAQVIATGSDGKFATIETLFDTFTTNNSSFEAEDFNFGGGQFIDNPPINAYENIEPAGVQDIDELAPTTVQPKLYRWAENVGTDYSPDQVRPQYAAAGVSDYVMTGVTAGEWFNYTRTLPAGHYNLYARLASAGAISVRVDKVTSDATQANQTTETLGWFKSAGTSAARLYQWVPLRDAAGNFLTLELGGVTTLRTTAETPYNASFFMLVPATLQAPVVTGVTPTPNSNVTNFSNGLHFDILSPGTGVRASGIKVLINGVDCSAGLTLTGTESAWSAHWGGVTANSNYTVQIQVVDKAGIDLGYPYTGTPLSNPTRTFSFGTFSEDADYALQFNGTNSFVSLGAAIADFSDVGDFTLAGWFNIRSNNAALQYLCRITGAEANTRRIQLTESNGVIRADIRPAAGGTIYGVSSSAFSYDTWTHIAFVRSGSQLSLFFNGQEVDSQPAVESAFPGGLWGYLGANTYNLLAWGAPADFFRGTIDRFELWTTALTVQQLQNRMTQPLAPATGLLAGWEFNEGAGNRAYDSSGHNLNSTISGAAWCPGQSAPPLSPVLTAVRNGTQLTLSWEGAQARLESAPALDGPWSAVEGAGSPHPVDMASATKQFFRLRVGN